MKKAFLPLACVLVGVLFTSCYNTRLLVGNVEPKEPLIEVNKEWNHGFIFGLVAGENATMNVNEYIGKATDYVIKTNQSFLNGLVSVVTFGIYTPTQTTYYIPRENK